MRNSNKVLTGLPFKRLSRNENLHVGFNLYALLERFDFERFGQLLSEIWASEKTLILTQPTRFTSSNSPPILYLIYNFQIKLAVNLVFVWKITVNNNSSIIKKQNNNVYLWHEKQCLITWNIFQKYEGLNFELYFLYLIDSIKVRIWKIFKVRKSAQMNWSMKHRFPVFFCHAGEIAGFITRVLAWVSWI